MRCDLQLHDVPSAIQDFIEMHDHRRSRSRVLFMADWIPSYSSDGSFGDRST
jgi:hypothetical protein